MRRSARRTILAALTLLATQATAHAQTATGDAALMPNGAGDAVSNMQGALLADPANRDQVLSLQDDPAMKAILADPETMRAVQAGDLGALMADPKIRAMLENPTVRGLVQQKQTR